MTAREVKTFLGTLQDQVAGGSLAALSAIAESLTLPKGTLLMEEGKPHGCFYILVQGSAKAFKWKDGEVACSWFAFENDVLATMGALDGQASDETIELIEDSTLVQINSKDFARLAEHNLDVARLSFHWLAEHTKFLGQQVDLHTLSSQDRYQKITEAHPELLQRVSLTDLASFLGMRRETLSRVRGKA
jgi:CRP-like cAMP-binding protein